MKFNDKVFLDASKIIHKCSQISFWKCNILPLIYNYLFVTNFKSIFFGELVAFLSRVMSCHDMSGHVN